MAASDWSAQGATQVAVNWKWYWKPNPNCYELDATPPRGECMEQSFAKPHRTGHKLFTRSTSRPPARRAVFTIGSDRPARLGQPLRAMPSCAMAPLAAWIPLLSVVRPCVGGNFHSVNWRGDTLDGRSAGDSGTLRRTPDRWPPILDHRPVVSPRTLRRFGAHAGGCGGRASAPGDHGASVCSVSSADELHNRPPSPST